MTRTRGLRLAGGAVVVAIALAGLAWTLLAPARPEDLIAHATESAGSDGFVITFSDADLNRWHIPTGQQLTRFPLAGKNLHYVRFAGTVPLNNKTMPWPERGLSLTLPLAFNTLTAGQTIEIGIVARRSPSKPAPVLSVVYATQQAGNSGWKQIKTTTAFATTTFTYNVPATNGGYKHPPIAVLNADPSGRGKAVDLLAVYVRPLGPRP